LRPSLRFLALVVFGWAGVRAATLGVIPGAALFRVEPSEAKAPPITATQFPPIEPLQPTPPMLSTADPPTEQPVAVVPTVIRYVQSVVGVPVAMRPGVVTVYLGARGCGSSSTSLCYDPSQQAAYQNAVLRMVTHELIHSLGGTNSNMANVMAPFVGVNSSGNQAWGVDCIVNKLPGLRSQASSPPLACY